MTPRRLGLREIGRIRSIQTGEFSTAWAAEAERFMLGAELATFARRFQDELRIDVIVEHGDVVGAAASYPDQRFDALRIGAIVVDHRHRGRGLGQAMLRSIVDRSIAVEQTVIWLIHPDNAPMLRASRVALPSAAEVATADGYLMFVAP